MLRGLHHRLVRRLSLHVEGDAEFHGSPPGVRAGSPWRNGQRFSQTVSTDCIVPVSDSALRKPSTARYQRSTPTAL